MTERERNLIRDAMMFAVKDITGRVMREATVQSMIDDFKKAINYTRCYVSEAEQFFCWDKKGKLSKQCESQCNVCFRYERNNKKNCT